MGICGPRNRLEAALKKTVKPAEVRQQLGDLLDRVALEDDEFVIERRGRPMAALVSVDKLQRIERAAELQLLDALEVHARKLTQAQVDEIANTAKHRNRDLSSRTKSPKNTKARKPRRSRG